VAGGLSPCARGLAQREGARSCEHFAWLPWHRRHRQRLAQYPLAIRFLHRSGRPRGRGALSGLAVAARGAGICYVDDATNMLRLLS
jgi:hypothetical protein